jgi:hypothetical protein
MSWLANQLRMNLIRYLGMLPNKFSAIIFFHIYIYRIVGNIHISVQNNIKCVYIYIYISHTLPNNLVKLGFIINSREVSN